MKHKTMMTIDVGIGGTGVAIWEGDRFYNVNCISITEKKSWETRCDLLLIQLEKILKRHAITFSLIAVEKPYIAFSGKSLASASSGDVIKLALLAGRVWQLCWFWCEEFQWVSVQEWKAQLPKKITEHRVLKRLPQLSKYKLTDHEFDALGIGLHLMGRF